MEKEKITKILSKSINLPHYFVKPYNDAFNLFPWNNNTVKCEKFTWDTLIFGGVPSTPDRDTDEGENVYSTDRMDDDVIEGRGSG